MRPRTTKRAQGLSPSSARSQLVGFVRVLAPVLAGVLLGASSSGFVLARYGHASPPSLHDRICTPRATSASDATGVALLESRAREEWERIHAGSARSATGVASAPGDQAPRQAALAESLTTLRAQARRAQLLLVELWSAQPALGPRLLEQAALELNALEVMIAGTGGDLAALRLGRSADDRAVLLVGPAYLEPKRSISNQLFGLAHEMTHAISADARARLCPGLTATQFEERCADLWGARVVAAALAREPRLTRHERSARLHTALFDLCADPRTPGGSDRATRDHPSPRSRIDAIGRLVPEFGRVVR